MNTIAMATVKHRPTKAIEIAVKASALRQSKYWMGICSQSNQARRTEKGTPKLVHLKSEQQLLPSKLNIGTIELRCV
ncbi:hypothetical protein SUGI_1488390 [Cryptomeria japonica]|uniref:Uncharacterized protein n=1 Tax=Cryptomeria japonica TaxID=3369 RepID=A0AAD3NU02_CRYJA|nr:hypothetical protein SUGI_1488390 [Cryptomeria japonica]